MVVEPCDYVRGSPSSVKSPIRHRPHRVPETQAFLSQLVDNWGFRGNKIKGTEMLLYIRSKTKARFFFYLRCFFSTWGRVWVHHLSLSSGHRWNSDGQWLSCPVSWSIKTVHSVYTEFIMIHSFAFIYICKQLETNGSATAHRCSGGGLNLSSGGELKLYLGCTGSTIFVKCKQCKHQAGLCRNPLEATSPSLSL